MLRLEWPNASCGAEGGCKRKKGWTNGSSAPPHPESSQSYTERELHKCPRGDPHPCSVPCVTTSISVPTTYGVQIWCPWEGAAELEPARIQGTINQRGCTAKGVPTAGKAQGKIRQGPLFGLARGSVDAPSWYHGGWWQCSRNAVTPRSCQLPGSFPVPHPRCSLSSFVSPAPRSAPRSISPCRGFISLQRGGGTSPSSSLQQHRSWTRWTRCQHPKALGAQGCPPCLCHSAACAEHQPQGCSQPPVTGAQWSAGMAAA